MTRNFDEIYFDPSRGASFGGVRPLVRESGVGVNEVRNWLMHQDAYTLHKPPRRTFPRRKTLSRGVDELWQADLADVSSLASSNGGHKFILTVIDVFSKFAWARALKNKNGATVTNAFESIIYSRKPNHLQTDKGTEFLNSTFQKLLTDNKIKFYTSQNEDIKCAVVERFNRTLKTRMFKYFTYAHTTKYLDVLQQFVDAYNNSYHRTIKTTPSSVDIYNENEIRKSAYPAEIKKSPKWKFDVGDTVRLCQSRRPFRKGYLPGWTTEIFTIKALISTDPPTYEIEDYDKEKIIGKFYAEELQKIGEKKSEDVYDIERVLKSRKRGNVKEYFVKWQGYPSKFNSWVSGIIVRNGKSIGQSMQR